MPDTPETCPMCGESVADMDGFCAFCDAPAEFVREVNSLRDQLTAERALCDELAVALREEDCERCGTSGIGIAGGTCYLCERQRNALAKYDAARGET